MHRLITQHPLRRGSHSSRDDGMCAMEMVAWLAGEAHSDEPGCSCPVLAALVRACNDAMTDDARNRHLRPLVPMLVNTRGSAAVEQARGMLVLDTIVRVLVASALRWVHRPSEARFLAEMAPVKDLSTARAALRALEHFAPKHHAAIWALQRAVEGTTPARYVAGAVHVARLANRAETWSTMVRLIERVIAVDASPADTDTADASAEAGS